MPGSENCALSTGSNVEYIFIINAIFSLRSRLVLLPRASKLIRGNNLQKLLCVISSNKQYYEKVMHGMLCLNVPHLRSTFIHKFES